MNKLKLLVLLAVAAPVIAFSQFEDQNITVSGSFSFTDNFGTLSPAVGYVLTPNQLLGARTLFLFDDGEASFEFVSIWFRHHWKIEASLPVYFYVEPQIGYIDRFIGEGILIGANAGFSAPIGSRFMFSLNAAQLQGIIGDDSNFNFNGNFLSGEFMIRF